MINVGEMRLEFNERLQPYFLQTVSKDGTKKVVSMEDAGYCKKIEFDIVLKREFVSDSGEPKVWYGLQHCNASIPNEKAYRYVYLYFEPKTMSNIAILYTDPLTLDSFGTHSRICTLIDFSDAQYVKKVGTPKKLTPEQLRLKLKEKSVLGIFKDDLKSQLAY